MARDKEKKETKAPASQRASSNPRKGSLWHRRITNEQRADKRFLALAKLSLARTARIAAQRAANPRDSERPETAFKPRHEEGYDPKAAVPQAKKPVYKGKASGRKEPPAHTKPSYRADLKSAADDTSWMLD